MIQKEEINICFGVDDNYIQHCAATMISILSNLRSNKIIRFYLLTVALGQENIIKIKEILKTYPNVTLEVIEIKSDVIKQFPLGKGTVSKFITISTYLRLLIPTIFPESINRIIYLDSDIIVNDDIDNLWKFELGEKAIAGVPDNFYKQDSNKQRLNISNNYNYINAGVLLIDVSKLRMLNFTNQALNYIAKNKDKIYYHDQDVLNATCYNQITYLPYKWNMMDLYLYKKPWCQEEDKATILTYQYKPSIIHYSGRFKPWHKECENPYKNLYFKYLKGTPWEHYKPVRNEKSLNQNIKRIIKRIVKGSPYIKLKVSVQF